MSFVFQLCEAQRWVSRPKPQVDSEFQSAKSKVSLSCDTGKMVFKMNFVEPFSGVVQIGPKATRECTLRGDRRRTSYTLTVSPDACGSCKEHTVCCLSLKACNEGVSCPSNTLYCSIL
ncbi:hypothetical protein AVEN_76082-1 [Araneus ventricosus]|uniref:ZP domain-containing protein n=1 Tax=Araneus ventricosus TaxID=182803 RepID=A0A4Y2XAZ8_ARAVE|nr:hypothetical protein AVEN_76082-1 [Araneus ventricosus]